MARIGFGLLAATGVLFCWSIHTLRAHDWTPVRVPMTMTASHETRAAFVADIDAGYDVQVGFRRNLPLKR